MFKVICDIKATSLETVKKYLPNKPIAPAAKKYNAVITYDNCKPCNIDGVPLSSTNKMVSSSYVHQVIKGINKQILSPINEGYFDNYEHILKKLLEDNNADLKFIGVFALDSGLANLVNIPFLEIFHAIIDTKNPIKHSGFLNIDNGYETGYMEDFVKYPYIKVTNTTYDTFVILGPMMQHDHDTYRVTKPTIAYLLRHQNAIDCPAIQYNTNTEKEMPYNQISPEYATFIEADIIEQLKLKLSIFRLCNTKQNGNILLYDMQSISTYEELETLCAAHDGKLSTMQNTIERACKNKPSLTLANNDILTITCENYKSNVHFDDKGEIVNIEITEIESLDLINNFNVESYDAANYLPI